MIPFDKGGFWQVVQTVEGNTLKYQMIKDTSKIYDWIKIKESLIEISQVDEEQILVKQTTRYQSKIFPQWYFAPFQRLALRQIHQWFISSWEEI